MINKFDLVSIIVPVYNKEAKLADCLKSIKNQTYKNLQIILIDDGSKDKSSEICDQFAAEDNRFVVRHIENGGVGNARNIGIKLSTGCYIQFVDADDYIDENMTQSMVDLCNKTNSDMAICGYRQIVRGNIVGNVYTTNKADIRIKDYFELIDVFRLDPLCGSPCNRIIKKDIIERNEIFFNVNATFAEDFMFVMDCVASCNKMCSTSSCFYNYNLDIEQSLSKVTEANIDSAWKQQIFFISYMNEYMQKNNMCKLYPDFISELYFGFISSSLLDRIKSGVNVKTVERWFQTSLNTDFEFDLKKVKTKYKRQIKDCNSRKRFIGLIYQRLLKLSILFHVQNIYIYMIQKLLYWGRKFL